MQIFIKTITGKTITIETDPNETVLNIKAIINDNIGIDPKVQILMYGGKHLQDNKKLIEYDIKKECTIHLDFRLNGGR